MNPGSSVAFEVSVLGLQSPMSVQIAAVSERCVASVQLGAISLHGLGANAREALVAALAPLGPRMTTAVMATPAMFGASAQVLAARVAV